MLLHGICVYSKSSVSDKSREIEMPVVDKHKNDGRFYRRNLPSTCVAYASPEGIRRFVRALGKGTALVHFKLMAQFRTQDERTFIPFILEQHSSHILDACSFVLRIGYACHVFECDECGSW